MFKKNIINLFLAITILLGTAWFYSALADDPLPSEVEQQDLPEWYATRHTSLAGSHTWDSDTDFLAGEFDQTEVIPSSGRITPARRWTNNAKINDIDTGRQQHPSLTVDNAGTFYIAWSDDNNNGIYIARSTDDGISWSSEVKVNNESGMSYLKYPSLVVDTSGTLYVAWQASFEGSNNIYIAMSTDSGESWSNSVKINDDNGTTRQDYPSLAVDASGKLYLVWHDERNSNSDIYFATSSDDGTTWSTNVKVNDDSGTRDQSTASLAVDTSGMIYITWQDRRNGNSDIYFSTSNDGGTTWSSNIKMNDALNSGYQSTPNVAVDSNGTLYIVWQGTRRYYSDIYLVTSNDGGMTWSSNIKLNYEIVYRNEQHPTLNVSPNDVLYVTWQVTKRYGQDRQENIYFIKSVDGGNHWESPELVNDGSGQSDEFWPSPTLAVNASGNVMIAWQDGRNGNDDIYTTGSPDNFVYNEGSYVSDIYDANELVAWDELNWAATLPVSSTITLNVRVGNSVIPDSDWSDWHTFTLSPANLGTLSASRYLQWQADFSTPISTDIPSLESVTLIWDSYSPTHIGGFITSDTTLQASNSPYLVTSSILIEEDVTLTIEPDTKILFSDHRTLVVEGTLIAQGTAGEPITFTSPQTHPRAGDWNNILFSDNSIDAIFDTDDNYVSGSILQHTIIEYGGGGSATYAVNAADAAPFVSQSTIRYNKAGGVRVAGDQSLIKNNTIIENDGVGLFKSGSNQATIAFNIISDNANTGLYNEGSEVTIHNNTISNNGSNYLYYERQGLYNEGSKVIIRNNTITNNRHNGLHNNNPEVTIHDNTISNNSSRGISGAGTIYNNIISRNSGGGIHSDGTIYNNTITNNSAGRGGGIYGDGTIYNNTITNNSAGNNGGGIFGHATIYNNIITDNSARNNGGGIAGSGTIYDNTISNNSSAQNGSGVYWNGSDGTLSYNTIISNTISGSGSTGGVYIERDYPIIRNNTIEDNDGYLLYNNNPYSDRRLDARYNWWGTTDNEAIEEAFFDWRDNGSKSIVNYEPFLSELAPSAPRLYLPMVIQQEN